MLGLGIGLGRSGAATGGGHPPPRQTLYVLMGVGQSLSVGGGQRIEQLPDPEAATVSKAPRPYPENALMLETGVRGFSDGSRTASSQIEAAYEVWNGVNLGETPGTGAMERIYLDSTEKLKYLFRATGKVGAPYSELEKGTAVYANGMADLQEIVDLADQSNMDVEVFAFCLTHGEANRALDTQNYDQLLVQWKADLIVDAMAVTGQSVSPLMFLDQLSNAFSGGTAIGHKIMMDMYNFAESNPDVYLVCPKYHMDNIDSLHLKANGYRQLGEYHGRAIQSVVDGSRWEPLKPVTITRTDDVIEIVTNASSQLVLDEAMRHAEVPANYGFNYQDDGSTAVIAGVTVVGTNTIQIQLDQIPTGTNQMVSYAFHQRSGFLRDSATGETAEGTPEPLYNACVAFNLLVS